MISCGYCGSLITAVAVDLFPTHYKFDRNVKNVFRKMFVKIIWFSYRGMALCLVMMFGRIGKLPPWNRHNLNWRNKNLTLQTQGAVVGSSFVGAFLDGECNLIFTINSSLLLGDELNHNQKLWLIFVIFFILQLQLSFASLLCGRLTRL